MKRFVLTSLIIGATSLFPLSAATLTGFPFADEDLAYSINWPSGLGLGESHIHAHHNGANWNFDLTIDAGIPGFVVKDLYSSVANAGSCSTSLTRNIAHGSRKTGEKETVEGGTATRTTTSEGGGNSQIAVPDCVKDALNFLFYTRRELGQGRVPPSQSILLGGLYPIRLEYGGAQTIKVNDQPTESDKILCTVSTAKSDIKFEVYFARDPARTPLVIKVPFAMGTFSMELVR